MMLYQLLLCDVWIEFHINFLNGWALCHGAGVMYMLMGSKIRLEVWSMTSSNMVLPSLENNEIE